MKVKIEIDTKTFVRFWLVVIGFGVAGLLIWKSLEALVLIGVAAFLALALNGPVSRLASKLPNRSRTLSVTISFTVIVAAIAAILLLAVPPIVQQTANFMGDLPERVREISSQWRGFGEFVARYHLEAQIDQAVNSLQGQATSWLASFGQNVISGVGTTISAIAAVFLVLVLTFLMLMEWPRWSNYVWSAYADQARARRHRALARRLNSVVSGYVSGQLIVSGLDGVFAGLAVFILSLIFPAVPANLALPTIAILFVMSLIPMFGATLGGTMIVLLLALNNVPAAIIFAVYFVIYQQIENNIISPAIQSKRIELSPLMVLLAVTIGLYMFGLLGGIISIPIAGCIKVFIDEYSQIENQPQKEKPVRFAKVVKNLKKKQK